MAKNGASKQLKTSIAQETPHTSVVSIQGTETAAPTPDTPAVVTTQPEQIAPPEVIHFITENNLFDKSFYEKNRHVKFRTIVEAIEDYQAHGCKILLDPHPLFDSAYYLKNNADVRIAGINPFFHFLSKGYKENRNPHILFDIEYCKSQDERYTDGELNPWVHYVTNFQQLDLNPHPLFDTKFYLDSYPDVSRKGLNPLAHFVCYGYNEGRVPSPYLHSKYSSNSDTSNPILAFLKTSRRKFAPDLSHYLQSTIQKLSDRYTAAQGVSAGSGKAADSSRAELMAFIMENNLFDQAFYERQRDREFDSIEMALEDYDLEGFHLGLNPHWLFDTKYYLSQQTSPLPHDVNPFYHFLKTGYRQNLDPHLIFNMRYCRSQHDDFEDSKVNPWAYFVNETSGFKFNPHPLFDVEFYQLCYGQNLSEPVNPLLHFITDGGKKKWSPSPYFDTAYYATRAKLPPGANPLIHFLRTNGMVASPNPLFDQGYYLTSNPDVRRAKANPFLHYLQSGKREGRQPSLSVDTLKAKYLFFDPARLSRGNWVDRKILVSSHDASRTGAPLIILNIVKELALTHHFDCLCILQEGGALVQEFRKYSTVLELDKLTAELSNSQSALRLFLFAIFDPMPEFALFNSAQSNPLTRIFDHFHIPTFTLIHEFAEPYPTSIIQTLIGKSTCSIFPAKAVLDSALKKIEIEDANAIEARIIPQGIFDNEFPKGDRKVARAMVRNEFGLDENTFICLAAGYVDLRKGCDIFLQVAKEVESRKPGAKIAFIWLGKMETPQRNNYAQWLTLDVEHAGLSESVFFAGERTVVDPYFLAADVFLMLSRQDPFPCVVLEAMAASLPIICFDRGTGSAEIVGSENGFIVPYLDANAVADSVLKLANDDDLRNRMGAANATLVKSDFVYSDYVRKLLDIVASYGREPLRVPSIVKSDKPKVIVPCSDWGVSGVNTAIETFGMALQSLGWDYEVLFTKSEATLTTNQQRELNADPATFKPRLPNVSHKFLSKRNFKNNIELWKHLIAYLERQTPCIMLTGYDYVANAITPALSNNVGVVAWNQSDDNEYYEQVQRLGLYWNKLICVSPQIKNRIIELNPGFAPRTEVVPNSIHIDPAMHFERRRPAETINIVYVGRIVQYQKRILDLIQLSEALEAERINYKLTVIGPDHDGSSKIIEQALDYAIARGKVVLTGSQPKETINQYLVEAHFFVLTSDFEGLSLSLLEAMAAGCVPVVYAMESGIPELIQNGKNGIVLDTRDYNVWARELQHAARSDQYLEMSRSARTTVVEEYCIDTTVSKMERVLRDVLVEIQSRTYERPATIRWKSRFGDVLPPSS